MEDFADLGTTVTEKSYHQLRPSPMRPTNVGLAQTTKPPGQKPLFVNGVVVGPFGEEEEGTGIISDVTLNQ